jgi:uncharacterized protein (DUF433 family)
MECEDPLLRRITRDPKVCDGRAAVRDTGITVSEILGALGARATQPEILAAHPALESTDIRAALRYATLVLCS